MTFGILLIIVGAIFLLESLGVLNAGLDQLWPVLVIAVGLLVLSDRIRRGLWRR